MKRVGGEGIAVRSSCSQVKNGCVEWVEKYFKDCVCDMSSEISFGFGLLSLVCWAVAEIPQIISNFQTKSGHGVSLALLLTWVIGDIFNLVGCLLEPVTLPTQLYTALLYTLTTVVLLVQTIYYDYFIRWWKNRGFLDNSEAEVEKREPLNPKSQVDSSKSIITAIPSARSCPRMDIYYTSARSLASSPTPPPYGSSYLVAPRSGPSATLGHDSSSDDETTLPAHRPRSKPKRKFSRSVGYGTVIATCASLPFQAQSLVVKQLVLSGAALFQETGVQEIESNQFGLLLGWIMAAIYMGGRLPQIYLNIKRGSVEGLSPLMFLFALIANASYVASILVRSLEWERIKANAPWLLDAIVCVLLDLFIIIQFGYYKMMHRRRSAGSEAPTVVA